MKYLVTGLSGFVGQHLLEHLTHGGAQVYGITRQAFVDDRVTGSFSSDMRDVSGLVDILQQIKPDRVVHLAASSSVGQSWKDPVGCFNNNVSIFLNLVEAIRQSDVDCRLLSVGSSEQYGRVDVAELPITESQAQNPESPYAVGRVSQEQLAAMYEASLGLDVVMTRSFNHIGPGQDHRFVVPSFVSRLLDAKAATGSHEVVTGDLSIVRDFMDVRDTVRAYEMLLDKGESGQAYNVCSGTGTSLQTLFSLCAERIGVEAVQRTDPEFVRPNEIAVVAGSNAKLSAATGWQAQFGLSVTVSDIVDAMLASSEVSST